MTTRSEPRKDDDEGNVRTSPAPCPVCRGSGHVILLHPHIDKLTSHERVSAGIGFLYLDCDACGGRGAKRDRRGEYRWPRAPERFSSG